MTDKTETKPQSRFNLPNTLSVVRIFGSVILVFLAVVGQTFGFVGLYVALGITDLIDGPLARWMKQESRTGAKLDSIADILLTCALIAGVCLLQWNWIAAEWYWFILPATSYAVVLVVSFTKFQRFPALHTLAAKINHFLVAVAGLSVLLNISIVPLRIVCITTLLANIESVGILLRLRNWQTDVSSLLHLENK